MLPDRSHRGATWITASALANRIGCRHAFSGSVADYPAEACRAAAATPCSGAWESPPVALLELLHRNVGVPLGGAQRGVPEHLLHFTQIGAAVEHMGRGTVPQGVRTDVRNTRLASLAMYDLPDNPLVDPAAPATKEQRLPRKIACKRGASGLQPLVQSTRRRRSERNDTLLIPLAGDADGALGEIVIAQAGSNRYAGDLTLWAAGGGPCFPA